MRDTDSNRYITIEIRNPDRNIPSPDNLLSCRFSRGSSVNPVCKSQPIDAVVELGWD